MNKEKEILKWSNPLRVVDMARQYFGEEVPIYLSSKKEKKYMIQDPNGRWVHFGQMGAEDFTKHQDRARRQRYLARATNIRGQWKDNPYSPNNLSINLLW